MTKSGFDRIVLPIVTIVSLTSFDSYAKTKQLPLFSPNALEVVNHEEPGISPESDSDGMEIKTEIAGSQVSIRKESKAGAEFLTIQVNQHQVSWKNGFSNYSYPYPRMPTEVHVYSPEEQIFESNSDELLIALGKRRHKKNNQQLVQTIDQYSYSQEQLYRDFDACQVKIKKNPRSDRKTSLRRRMHGAIVMHRFILGGQPLLLVTDGSGYIRTVVLNSMEVRLDSVQNKNMMAHSVLRGPGIQVQKRVEALTVKDQFTQFGALQDEGELCTALLDWVK